MDCPEPLQDNQDDRFVQPLVVLGEVTVVSSVNEQTNEIRVLAQPAFPLITVDQFSIALVVATPVCLVSVKPSGNIFSWGLITG